MGNVKDKIARALALDASTNSVSIPSSHIFIDDTTRDTYFTAHPNEKITGTTISVGSGYEKFDGTNWISATGILRGEKGEKGDKGDTGASGANGNSVLIKDEGTLVESNISEINFTGNAVTTTKTDTGKVQVTISGTGGGSSFSGNATDVNVDTSNFTKNLTSSENTVQKALDKIDDLNLGGSSALTVNTVTSATYTAVAEECILANDTSNSITVTLPASSTWSGQQIIIKKITNVANTITITPNGSEKIDGNSTLVISNAYNSATLISDGSNVYII